MSQGDFVVRRLWISAASGRWASLQPDITQITVVVEGALMIRTGRQENRLGSGHAVQQTEGGGIAVESRVPVAFLQIETRSIPRTLVSIGEEAALVLQAHPALREMLVGQISATVNAVLEPSAAEFAYVKRSIEYAAMALLVGSAPQGNPTGSSSERRLYRRAVELIAVRAADPRLTLDDVAGELSISRSYLQRVFRGTGSTPLGYLRRTRAAFARDLLHDKWVTDQDELDSIAGQAGFSSARAMREALRREDASTR